MKRTRAAARAGCSLLALSAIAAPCAGQSSFVARLSADTVEVGEAFSLLVRVPVPAGSVVHFPDTVARTDFLESHGPVRWQAEPDASGGAVLTLEYSVLAYGVGVVPVPGFDVFVSPSGDRATGTPIPGGSSVGSWDDAPTSGAAYLRPLRVPRRGVWVNPVFTPEQIEAGVQPMASADVLGSSWHWASLLAALVFGGVLAAVLVRSAPAWLGPLRGGSSPASERWTPDASRRHALAELARLQEEGLAASGRVHELYTRSSGLVRQHVSRVNPELGSDLTSSELMRRLDITAPAIRHAPLSREMLTAEVVKFGRLRPEQRVAEGHLAALRAWLEEPVEPTTP
jgi:hypothetical protein